MEKSILNLERNECSGCHACYSICPKNCISMVRDEEGFLYPEIDKTQCINCGLCQKSCQAMTPIRADNKPLAFAAYNKNDSIRIQSSSGGIFSLVAEWILNQNGVVFGPAFDDQFYLRHIAVLDPKDLEKLRGSKYVQSEIGNAYLLAGDYLKQGRTVLFTGTPCQIDGLIHFLNKPYPNLYTQDIICHGVPSPVVWKKYTEFREARAASKTRRIFFRNKKYGWKTYSVLFEFTNNTEYKQIFTKDVFIQGFLANLFLRPSCYQCNSKGISRNSDLTLADFWGIDKLDPTMFDNKGTSLVLLHSEKGRKLWDAISAQIVSEAVESDAAISFNIAALESCPLPSDRQKIVRGLTEKGFTKSYLRYIKNINGNILKRGLRFIKRRLKHFFR